MVTVADRDAACSEFFFVKFMHLPGPGEAHAPLLLWTDNELQSGFLIVQLRVLLMQQRVAPLGRLMVIFMN